MNTAEILAIAGGMVPDRVAVSDPDASVSYAGLQARVRRLAHALHALGVGKGQNVGIMSVNSNQFVELYYAAATVGATFVPSASVPSSDSAKNASSRTEYQPE